LVLPTTAQEIQHRPSVRTLQEKTRKRVSKVLKMCTDYKKRGGNVDGSCPADVRDGSITYDFTLRTTTAPSLDASECGACRGHVPWVPSA